MARDARSDLVGIPENPVPEGATVAILTASDGVRLRAARWPATSKPVKGTVCLFQGRSEFIEKYFETIADLRARGFAVATLDWRGQGGSARLARDPRKGHVGCFSDYQRDMDVFMNDFVLPECPAPLFALAHSMGGAIATIAARRRFTWFERLVLTAPMFGLPGRQGSASARGAVSVLACLGLGRAIVPLGNRKAFTPDAFDGNVLTSDPGRFARTAAILKAAPELGIGAPTNGWLRAAFKAMDAISARAFPSALRTPVLVFTAANDRVVDNAAISAVARRLRTARVIPVDNARHEILMEGTAVRERFLAAFDRFVPGTPAFPD